MLAGHKELVVIPFDMQLVRIAQRTYVLHQSNHSFTPTAMFSAMPIQAAVRCCHAMRFVPIPTGVLPRPRPYTEHLHPSTTLELHQITVILHSVPTDRVAQVTAAQSRLFEEAARIALPVRCCADNVMVEAEDWQEFRAFERKVT